MFYYKDGYSLHYNILGEGDENILLLHNAGGNQHFFKPQIQKFRRTNKLIAIDFLGHGKSCKPIKEYTILGYARETIEFLKKLNWDRLTIIGLNYGANVAIQIANLLPIDSLILIEPPIFLKNIDLKAIEKRMEEIYSEKSYREHLVESSFIKISDEYKKIALEAYQMVPNYVLHTIYADLVKWNKHCQLLLDNIDIPTLFVATESMLFSCQKLLKNPRFKLSKILHSYYWPTLEAPKQLNNLISHFLQLSSEKNAFRLTKL